jgi:hypothetical protein
VGKKLSRLIDDWSIEFRMDGKLYRLTITSGFLFDGASIPRLLWTFLGLAPHGIMDGPALPHDGGYEVQGVWTLDVDGNLVPAPLTGGATATFEIYSVATNRWLITARAMSKKELDELLKQLCKHFNIVVRAPIVWLGVKLGGCFAWRSNDKSRKYKLLAGS